MNIQDINRNIQFVFRFVSECLAVVLCCTAAQAQKQTDVKDYVDFGLEIANNHLWRGIEVSDGLVMCVQSITTVGVICSMSGIFLKSTIKLLYPNMLPLSVSHTSLAPASRAFSTG